MSGVFEKNISELQKKNSKLAEKLLTYIPTEIPKLINENGTYNFQYRNIFIHNKLNPLAEAREVFSMATNEPVAIHVVYGLGLGYLFQVASLNSNGTVILYEPDLNILKTAFMLVDFSEDIKKKNVYVLDNVDEVIGIVYKNSNTDNTPQMLSLPSARTFNQEAFDEVVRKLQEAVGAFSLDLKYTKEKFYPSLKLLLQNIPYLIKETPLCRFKDCYKNKTAVIVSAGPSLDKNIETLKKYRDKYVLLTVGTAVKTLYKNGIVPDFLCIIETFDSSKQIRDLDLSNVYFITEPYSNTVLRTFKYKKILSHISNNAPVNVLWSQLCGEDISEYSSKGTVSYTALNSARILGCSKIILVGQDLAYTEGQCYSKDSVYKDLVCKFNKENDKWEITAENFEEFASAISPSEDKDVQKSTALRRLERLNNSLYYVKGIKGDMIPTESVYSAFIKPLSEFTERYKGVEYINTSLTGAQIDGFENMDLESALNGCEPVEKIDLTEEFTFDSNLVVKNLENKVNELEYILKLVDEAQGVAKNLINNLKRKKTVDKDILSDLKRLSVKYLALSSEWSEKSKIFDFITVADKIDLDYEMKMMKEFNYENTLRIASKMYEYFENSKAKSAEIKQMIKGIV